MKTLYIDRKDTTLVVDRDRLIVRNTSLQQPLSVALSYLSSIVISSKTQMDSHVLLACAKHEVNMVVLDAKSYQNYAQYLPPHHGIVQRKLQQFHLISDADLRLHYAKQLMRSTTLQQLRCLQHWQLQYGAQVFNSQSSIERIKANLVHMQACENIDQLRGFEGNNAKIVFQAVAQISPAWCKFKGRNRRPPLDPINVLLSLSYSLMYAECSRALTACALDPMLGIYHDALHGRHSLACDLNERIRVALTEWVIQILQEQQLQAWHFTASEQHPCILSKEGRAIFYPLWQSKFKVWKKFIRLNAQTWAKLVDEIPDEKYQTHLAV